MKKLITLTLSCLLAMGMNVVAQQALWQGSDITSPEIGKDNRVTFRLYAPKATEVKISGEWMPSDGQSAGSEWMINDGNGLWSYTTESLPSDLYSYSFMVDSLKSIDQSNVYPNRDVSSLFNIFITGDGKGDLYKVNNVPHGTVSKRWYNSPLNEFAPTRRMTVYTPPGYENSDKSYPVLYLLHGMGGDEDAWMTLGRTAQIMDNLIAEGKVEPMIVVMPNGNVVQEAAPGESSLGMYKPVMLLPHSMDGKFEETFPDIISFVDDNYRTVAHKSGRAIAGLSMGGFHSLHVSRLYPNTFDYIGLFSAAVDPRDTSASKIYENTDKSLALQKQNGYKMYWIGMGKDDFLYDEMSNYRGKLDEMKMPYLYNESEGGHSWTNWRTYLTEFTPLLFK